MAKYEADSLKGLQEKLANNLSEMARQIVNIITEIHKLPLVAESLVDELYSLKFDFIQRDIVDIYITQHAFSSYRIEGKNIIDKTEEDINTLKELVHELEQANIRSVYTNITSNVNPDQRSDDIEEFNNNVLSRVVNKIHEIMGSFSSTLQPLLLLQEQKNHIDELIQKAEETDRKLSQKDIELRDVIKSVEAATNVSITNDTRVIYNKSSIKNSIMSWIFDFLFLIVFFGGLWIYEKSDFLKPYDTTDIVQSLLPRLFFASAYILLITFLLRRGTQYRKIAQQSQQTALELAALPSFVINLRKEDKFNLYKDLSTKYFGKELDQTQNDKVANLIQDQAKMSIELAQSANEIVKSLKESTSSSSSEEEKPNDDSK